MNCELSSGLAIRSCFLATEAMKTLMVDTHSLVIWGRSFTTLSWRGCAVWLIRLMSVQAKNLKSCQKRG